MSGDYLAGGGAAARTCEQSRKIYPGQNHQSEAASYSFDRPRQSGQPGRVWAKVGAALAKGLIALFGGVGAVLVIFPVIAVIAAVLCSPFGILYMDEAHLELLRTVFWDMITKFAFDSE